MKKSKPRDVDEYPAPEGFSSEPSEAKIPQVDAPPNSNGKPENILNPAVKEFSLSSSENLPENFDQLTEYDKLIILRDKLSHQFQSVVSTRDTWRQLTAILMILTVPTTLWINISFGNTIQYSLGLDTLSALNDWILMGFIESFLLVAINLWAYTINLPYIRTDKQLKDYDELIRLERTATLEGRFDFLHEEARRLTFEIARVFLDNPDRYKIANKWRESADNILEQWQEEQHRDGVASESDKTVPPADLGQAETLIGQIKELILREENELRQQVTWRNMAIVIMVVYVFAIVGAVILSANKFSTSTVIPVVGVPASVVLWGAIGSLGAILYRLYSERERVRLDLEVRWLIARPIIGIIMGGLAYLAILTGLLVFGASSIAGGDAASSAPAGRIEVYWVVAFLAGFSDKFYKRINDLLVDKTINQEKAAPSSPLHTGNKIVPERKEP